MHKVDLHPDTCNACKHVSRMIRPDMLKELVRCKSKDEEEIPSAAARFMRSDEKPPTLVLSESSMSLASKVFSLGRFKVSPSF